MAEMTELLERVQSGELTMEEATDLLHAEKHPEGCGQPGHRCERCQARLGERPHKFTVHKGRGSQYYRAKTVITCDECNYRTSL